MIGGFSEVSQIGIFVWVANLLLQVTCVMVLAILFATIFSRRAVLAHGVLVGGLWLVLLSPLTTCWMQQSGLQFFSWTTWAEMRPALPSTTHDWPEIQPRESSAFVRPFAGKISRDSMQSRSLEPANTNGRPPEILETDGPLPTQTFETRVGLILAVFGGVWCFGGIVMAIRFIRGWTRLLRLVQKCEPVAKPAAQRLFQSMVKTARLPRAPQFLESSSLTTPIAIALPHRSAIIFPAKLLSQIRANELGPLLTHELAHLARRDQWALSFQHLAAVVFWFHPLVYFLNARLSRCREEVCDNHVLAQNDAAGYSRSLLRVAEMFTPKPVDLLSLSLMSSLWSLETRISGILDNRRNTMTRCSRSDMVVICLMLLASGLLASVVMVGHSVAKPTAFTIQDDGVGPCVLGFAARPSEIVKSDFAKSTGIVEGARLDPQFELFHSAESVRGAISLPEDFTELLPTASPRPPFEYYVEFKLTLDSRESSYYEFVADRGDAIKTEGDAEYFRLGGEVGPIIVFEKKMVTLLSDGFKYNPKKLPALTSAVKKQLEQHEQADGVLVIDCKQARNLIESGIKFAQENSRDKLVERLDSLAEVEWLAAVLKIDNVAAIDFETECTTNQSATEIADLFQELVALGENNIPQGGSQAKMLGKVLDSVRTRVSGKLVRTSLEFDEITAEESRQASVDAQITNNHRQAALGVHNFLAAHQSLPFQPAPGQSELLSWRVRILPMLDSQELYDRFDLSKPWDSPQNLKLLKEMPRIFGEGDKTNLCWIKSNITDLADITRGTSNTIAFVHSDKFVNWTANNDVTPAEVLDQFKNLKPGEHIIATFYDGSVRRISAETDFKAFEAMLYPNDGD